MLSLALNYNVQYTRFACFPSLLLPPLPAITISHLAYCTNLVSAFTLDFFVVHSLYYSLTFLHLKCKSDDIIPLLKASCHIQNKIQTPHQGLPGTMFCHCLPLFISPFISLDHYPISFFCVPDSLALSLELATLVPTLGHLDTLYTSILFSQIFLPAVNSLVPFRSQFTCCLFKKIASQ